MSYSSPLAFHYLELASVPIQEGRFAGEDARFSPAYEALEVELGKARSLHPGEAVNWQKVCDDSEALLRTVSKDLRIAAWLTWALYQRESFQGLLAGLGLLQHLCKYHWHDIHPIKPRARSGALTWLVPRLEQALRADVAVCEQPALFGTLAEHLDSLDTSCAAHLGDDSPPFASVSRRLRSLRQSAVIPLPVPDLMTQVVAPVQHATAQVFQPGMPIGDEPDASKALRAQHEGARLLCSWWLRQSAGDLRALRLNRVMMWLHIDHLPAHDTERLTSIPALSHAQLHHYQQRYDQAEYADLLVELEAGLADAPFWLDGHRMVWECLHCLDAHVAMREIERLFLDFTQRLPGIVELRFRDGTPFADAATRAWIADRVSPPPQVAETPSPAAASGMASAWESALEDALPILHKHGLKTAAQPLQHGMRSAHGGRARCLWQLALARLCFAGQHYELAEIQLAALDRQLTDSGLQAWDPDIAVQVLQWLHRCYGLLPQHPAAHAHQEQIYRRLSHLDLDVVLD